MARAPRDPACMLTARRAGFNPRGASAPPPTLSRGAHVGSLFVRWRNSLPVRRTLTARERILRRSTITMFHPAKAPGRMPSTRWPLHLGKFGIDFRRRCPVASLGDEWQGCGWQIAFQRQTGGAAIENGA